jgi:twitching motility protein PilT
VSRFHQLFDAVIKTQADELRMISGEKIHILRKGTRQDIGKEPLRAVNIDPLASEGLSPTELRSLDAKGVAIRQDYQGKSFSVSFSRFDSGIAVSIRPEVSGAPAAAAGVKPAGEPAPIAAIAAEPGDSGLEIEAPRRAAPAMPAPEVQASMPKATASTPHAPSAPEHRGISRVGAGKSGLDELLADMIARKASDLHLSADVVPAMRVHGEMHFFKELGTLTSDGIEAMLRPIMSEKALADFAEKNDADFAYEIPGLARFRVNVFRDRKGVGTVARQIPIEIISAEKLGLPKGVLDLCFLSKGLVVVTGPTGSGKSTTLAGMVDHINKNRNDHIITIEDPVEFVHPNIKCLVNQREVGQHTKSFKNALRAALREDPDIVLVGEMRDLETISIAIETAETGHLVFGTLHTTTAQSTIDRIIDQFPPDQQQQIRVMLSESLKGVVAQVLCKKIGGGRIAALEILLINNAVSSLIRDAKTFQIPSVMQTSKGLGMRTMNDSLLELVQNKLVTPEDAFIKAVDKAGLTMMYKNNNITMKAAGSP